MMELRGGSVFVTATSRISRQPGRSGMTETLSAIEAGQQLCESQRDSVTGGCCSDDGPGHGTIHQF